MELPDNFNSIKGFIDDEEGECLYRTALKSAERGPIMEIGSYCGKSTVYLGIAAKKLNSCVYSVDHHTGSEENQVGWEYHDKDLYDKETGRINSFPEFIKNIRNAELLDTVIPIVSDSSLVSKFWTIPLSMILIDGGQTREAALDDLNNGNKKVMNDGGILAIHDVFPDPKDGGRPPYEIYKLAIEGKKFKEIDHVKSLRILKRLN